MKASERALKSFLKDGIRLADESVQLLYRFQAVRRGARDAVVPGDVVALFEKVHTLKGTATLIQGAQGVVDALQEFESLLACQSPDQTAKAWETWIEAGLEALTRARGALWGLRLLAHPRDHGSEELASARVKARRKSTQRRARLTGRKFRQDLGALFLVQGQWLWLPQEILGPFLSAFELSAQGVVCCQGKWFPVIAHQPGARGAVGVTLPQEEFRVLAFQELKVGVSWKDAKALGAADGVDWLHQLSRKRKLKAAS